MKLSQISMCAAAVLMTAGIASAQSGGMNPGSGTGTNPGSGSGAPTGAPTDLDLPLEKPEYVGDPVDEEPPTPEEPIDDPSDEPPPTIYGEEIDSENDTIFYVLDVSCSMGWDRQSYTTVDGQRRSGPRIDRAKAELVRSIMGLSENFKFNIIGYDCGTRQWRQAMQEANDANKQAAMGWIGGLQPTGATGTGPATSLGLSDKENMSVVLLTDGAPNCGANGQSGHRRMIRNANTQGATINVFGIAASGSYRSFCQGVAADSGGSYFDVP